MFVTVKNISLFTIHGLSFIRPSGPAGACHSRPFEMTDVHDKKTRSFNMSRIRSKDTKPELLVRKFLSDVG